MSALAEQLARDLERALGELYGQHSRWGLVAAAMTEPFAVEAAAEYLVCLRRLIDIRAEAS